MTAKLFGNFFVSENLADVYPERIVCVNPYRAGEITSVLCCERDIRYPLPEL